MLQNESNLVDYIIERASRKKMVIALNPSPFEPAFSPDVLRKVSIFLLNEVEGEQMTGEREPERILGKMLSDFPGARVVLTLGEAGVLYQDGFQSCSHKAYPVPVVDTTAAGDTFTGYFLSELLSGGNIEGALSVASLAAAAAVSKKGAADSILTGKI